MRKVLTASVVLAVAVSVMALFALGLTYGGVQQGVRASAERGGAQIMVVPRDAAADVSDTALLFTGAPAPVYFPVSTAEAIGEVEGVGRATTQFFSQTLNESCCSTAGATRLIGVDFARDWTVQPFSGRDLSVGLADDEVILGADVGGDVGDRLSLLGRTFTIVEKLEPSGADLDDSLLLAIDTARSLSEENLGLSYLWDKYGAPGDLVSCVLADLDGTADASVVLNRINALDGVYAFQRSEVVEASQKQLETVFLILLGAGVLMLASTLVQLFARFYSCVWERKSELALYRAMGASKGQLRALIGGEVAAIVGAGLVSGLACGAGLYVVLMDLLQDGSAFPFISPDPGETGALAAVLAAAFALLALAAIAAPLAQIGRLDPSLAFVSPSGSGKSTLLSMLGLLLSSTTGTVVVDGQDSDALGDKELSRLRRETFGFVFQHTQLVGSLRAVENVMAPANFAGKLPFDARERAEQLLGGLGLADRLMHYPYQLSIGQKRRVSVARALLLDPPIVIADEPTNDLDADSSSSVADTLFERAANGGILLFATHDRELASRASRVMHLEGKTFVER